MFFNGSWTRMEWGDREAFGDRGGICAQLVDCSVDGGRTEVRALRFGWGQCKGTEVWRKKHCAAR